MRLPIVLIGATVLLLHCLLLAGPVRAQSPALIDLLPGSDDVGSDVAIVLDQTRSLTEHADGFTDPQEAAQLLAEWGWSGNAVRQYESVLATAAPRPYLYVSLTRFDDARGAAAAMPYLIQDLAAVLGHREIPAPHGIGDETRQFIAPIDGGTDLTLYVRSGALLMRISVLLSNGEPIADPEQIAELIMQRVTTAPTATPAGMTFPQWDVAPLLEAVPSDLPDCLRLTEEEPLDFATLVTRFPGVPDAETQLEELGWRTGAHRQYTCDPLPPAGTSWLDMSVHAFSDASSATAAIPFFAYARTVGTQLVPAPAIHLGDSTAAITGPSENGTEYTLYLSTGRLVFRVSAVAAQDSPQADIEYVMTALMVNALNDDAAAPPRAHNLGVVTEATDTPQPPADESHEGSLYISTDPVTGRTIATYPDGTWVYVTPASAPRSGVTPVPTQPPLEGNCDPSYPDVCIPPVAEVGDLDCKDIDARRFRVLPPDPHHFDGPYDGSNPNEPDGIGCELG